MIFILTLCVSLLMALAAHAVPVTNIIGGATGSPAPFDGRCAAAGRTLNLTHVGTVNVAINASGSSVFKAGPAERNGLGRGYAIINDGLGNTVLITYSLETTLPTATDLFTLNNSNSPDISNASRANLYNPTSQEFLYVGTRNNGICLVNNCPHFRSFSGIVPAGDVDATGVEVTSVVFRARATSDETYTYIQYVLGGSNVLRRFTGSAFLPSATLYTETTFNGLATDETFFYATFLSGGNYHVKRVNPVDETSTNFSLFGPTVTTTLAYGNGFLYAVQVARILKIRVSDMTIVGTLITDGTIEGGLQYDALNDRLYAVQAAAGSINVRRINPTSFTIEQTLNIVSPIPQGEGTGYDFLHQSIYQAIAGNPFPVVKVSLCT